MDENRIVLIGRIDSNNAYEVEERIMAECASAPDRPVVFDAEDLEYIASAGLRILIRVSKTITGKVSIINVRPAVYDVFEMTGFTKAFDVKRRMRSISVDGCQELGSGFAGTVYRYDDETIVKVYKPHIGISMIENEREMARRALISGIPTAIAYDIVKVGDSYGSVFELVKSETYNDMVRREPEAQRQHTSEYVEFIKLVHSTEMKAGVLPLAKDIFSGYLDTIKKHLTGDQYARYKELLEAMPEDHHVIHGDFQMKNVMAIDGEPVLIDMDTLAAGDPVFDLAPLYVAYEMFEEDEPGNCMGFFGMPHERCTEIWKQILAEYTGFKSESENETAAQLSDRIKAVAAVRFLYVIEISALKEGELGALRIKHTRELISRILPGLTGLEIRSLCR